MAETMEGVFAKTLDELYKKQDSRNLLKILINIRKGVEWPKHQEQIKKLRTKGYLKHVIRTLQMRKKRIIDTALSILGNCFMDKECARKAMVYNILTSLDQVLKRFPKDNNINGRIFRILGNMCIHRDQWATTIIQKKIEFVTHTVEFLKVATKEGISENTASEATLIMALRLLRLLVNRQTAVQLLNSDVLEATGSLLIKVTAEWEECGDNEELIANILKVLHEYSRYECRDSLAQMENTERGDSLACLGKVLLLSPKRVVKTAMNFTKVSTLKSQIPITDMFNRLTAALSDLVYSDINESTFTLIRCACFLLDETPNRHREGAASCVNALIDVLETFEEPSNAELEYCVLIVSTLGKCRFDDQLMKRQVKSHVVRAMVDKLKWAMGITEETLSLPLNKHKMARKRGGSLIAKLQETKKRKPCRCSEDSQYRVLSNYCKVAKYMRQTRPDQIFGTDPMVQFVNRREKSPSSCSSEESDVPLVSSPCASPSRFRSAAAFFRTTTAAEDAETDSDDYSPVCSEADSAELNLDNDLPSTSAERYGHMEDESETEEGGVETGAPPEEHPVTENLKLTLIEEIERLISAHLNLEQTQLHFASEELLVLLIRCALHYKKTHEGRTATIAVVNKAFRCSLFVVPLMESTLAEKLFAMTQYQHNKWCFKCMEARQFGQQMLDTLMKMTYTIRARGNIGNVLSKGPKATKQQLVMSIPYIITEHDNLHSFLIGSRGLDVLMDIIENHPRYRQRAIAAVCILASRRLDILNPTEVAAGPVIVATDAVPPKCPPPSRLDPSDRLVTFKLDDGSSVEADRELLTKKSDYFASLLSGSFKESAEKEIALHDVKRNSLVCVLELINQPDPFGRLMQKNFPVAVLLDAVVLCDKYLLQDELASLTSFIEKHKLSPRTVAPIYQWSLQSNLNLLRVEAVAFALVHDFGPDVRTATFSKLFELGFGKALVEDIRALLERFLKSTPSTYDSSRPEYLQVD